MTISVAALDAVSGRRALFLMAHPGGPITGAIHKGKTLPLAEAIHLWRSRQWQQMLHAERIEPESISQLEDQ